MTTIWFWRTLRRVALGCVATTTALDNTARALANAAESGEQAAYARAWRGAR